MVDLTLRLRALVLEKFPTASSFLFKAKRLLEDPGIWSKGVNSRFVREIKRGPKVENQLSGTFLIVVPPGQLESGVFGPGLGNYHFELFKSAQEIFGESSVSTYFLDSSVDFESNIAGVLQVIRSSKIDTVLFHIESNDTNKGFWRWDILALALSALDQQVRAIGFLTDGVYYLHQVFCKRFLDIHPKSIFIQIDRRPETLYVPEGQLVGPTFLPISNESVDMLVREVKTSDRKDKEKITFIGKVYSYRAADLSKLEELGLEIEVNPHQGGNPSEKPSYSEFFQALVASKFTLNFSRANGAPNPQLKSRMLEARLAGCVPITDDRELNSIIFDEGRDFIFFGSFNDIPEHIERWDRVKKWEPNWFLSSRFAEVRTLAQRHFWDLATSAIEPGADNSR